MCSSDLVAVQADSYEDAIASADAVFTDYESSNPFSWSDWGEVGGRWAGCLDGKNALRYTDNPLLFEEELDRCFGERDKAVVRFLENNKVSLIDLEDGHYSENDIYPLFRAVSIAAGHAKWDAGFYDLNQFTESREYLDERIKSSNSKEQWLVALDLHY